MSKIGVEFNKLVYLGLSILDISQIAGMTTETQSMER